MTIAESDPRPSSTEARWFGLLLLAIFCLLGGLLGWQLGSLRVTQVLAGCGVGIAALYYGVTPLRNPLYRTWMALTMPLGRLVSTVILAAIYFVVLTPIALLMRALGRDHLQRRLDPSAQSYWHRYASNQEQDRYFRQS